MEEVVGTALPLRAEAGTNGKGSKHLRNGWFGPCIIGTQLSSLCKRVVE